MNNPHFYAYGDTEVSNDTQPYHYTQCGLDDIFLLNGFHWYKVGNEGGVAVQDAEGLHKAIALNIVRNKAILCGKDVRFLRKLLDFTQAELALWLGYSSQQVARWKRIRERSIRPPKDSCESSARPLLKKRGWAPWR